MPITATEREIAKQINTLETYAEMGKTKPFDTDFPFLPRIIRTPDAIAEAKKQIEQDEGKLLYSLFWFWKNNSVDELAFELLKEGNTEKALNILEKSALSNKHKVYKPVALFENLIRQSTSWSELDNEDHILHKNEDEYIVHRKSESSGSIPCVTADLNYNDNWSIECSTQWFEGPDNIGYGIVFGRDKGNYFTFEISGNGYYCFGKTVEWIYTKSIPWKKDNLVNKWSTNHLKIKKTENLLSLYINEEFVDSIPSEPFFGKSFGFSVNKNQKVSFRNFKFCELAEDETYGEGLNVSSKNFSNIKNLSTLYLGLSIASIKGTFKISQFLKGIALAKNIFGDGNMNDYSKLIAGDRYKYNSEKAMHFYISDILDSVTPFLDNTDGISINELIRSFANFPIEAKQFLNNRFVAKQIQNIYREIERSQAERKSLVCTATDSGKNLVRSTKTDILYLRKILGDEDYQYQTIVDKLSLAIVQCGVEAFNTCKTPGGEIDYAKAIRSEEGYLQEYEYALSIAATQRVKDRAKENLDTCKHYIENKALYSCWFCGNNPPEEVNKFEITIYKETYRSYFPRRVQFSYASVTIPRCSECQKVHSKSSDSSTFAFIGSAVVGVIIGIIADGYWFAGLLIGGLMGWVVGQGLKGQKTSKANIKDTSHSTIRNCPVLHKKLNEGWQFSKPSA